MRMNMIELDLIEVVHEQKNMCLFFYDDGLTASLNSIIWIFVYNKSHEYENDFPQQGTSTYFMSMNDAYLFGLNLE
jgi:hypothetical protein